jgi:hypothetical protein
LTFCSRIARAVALRETASSEVVRELQEEESNLKSKKSRKSANPSDEEERLSDAAVKEKKVYLNGLVGRLSREKEKYSSIEFGQYGSTMVAVEEGRQAELARIEGLR